MPVVTGRTLRATLSWAAVVTAAVVLWPNGSAAQDADLHLGAQLYAANCAVCHGTAGEGNLGDGIDAGPPLADVDVAYVDLTLRTGRMPIVEPRVGITRAPDFDDAQRAAIVDWLRRELDLSGAVPDVGVGDVAQGADLYARHCAACHGSTGEGGISAGGTLVRAVKGVDRVAVVEALRVGPFRMPVFEREVIDDASAEDIATYVEYMGDAPRTPLGLVEVDRVTMTVLAVVLVVVAVGVMVVVARPVALPQRENHSDG